jgi:hypothetical protein
MTDENQMHLPGFTSSTFMNQPDIFGVASL